MQQGSLPHLVIGSAVICTGSIASHAARDAGDRGTGAAASLEAAACKSQDMLREVYQRDQ